MNRSGFRFVLLQQFYPLTAQLADGRHELWVLQAMRDEVPVGYLNIKAGANFVPSVEFVWVHPDWRRQGYATALIERAVQQWPNVRFSSAISSSEDSRALMASLFRRHPEWAARLAT